MENFLTAFGLFGVFLIVFAESGLLIGFFLPGDSLIFTVGFLASQGIFNIYIACLIIFLAAVIGDSVGYSFGKRIGPKLFKKEDSLFFHKKNIEKAQKFYDTHGKKTIVLARFIPVIRTFTPIIGGVAKMQYKDFVIFNILGGFLWSIGVTLAGYFLGKRIPNIDHYLLPIIILIILVSILPTVIHILKDKNNRDEIYNFLLKISKRSN